MRRSATLAFLFLCALVPATASAELPAPKSTSIVPGTSIAGVAIGMSVERAVAAWGPGSACTKESRSVSCFWQGTDLQGSASFVVDAAGRVVLISVSAGRRGDDLAYSGPLLKWRTRKKSRIGVTSLSVARAYPRQIKSSPSGLQLGSGKRATTFHTSSNRIYMISIGPLP